MSALGDEIRNEANAWTRGQNLLVLALKVDLLSDRLVAVIEATERVRALADMWASETSSDEQDYITAAKYRAVARDIYKALEEN